MKFVVEFVIVGVIQLGVGVDVGVGVGVDDGIVVVGVSRRSWSRECLRSLREHIPRITPWFGYLTVLLLSSHVCPGINVSGCLLCVI